MKTQLKLFLFLALLAVGFKGSTQCNSTFSTQVSTGGAVYIYNFGVLDSAGFTNSSWSFGDGTYSYNNQNYFTHTYSSSGTYTICYAVFDSVTLCTDTTCTNVVINMCQGAAAYNSTWIGFGEYILSCPGLSTLSGSTASWDFGDGSTSTAASPTHTFAANGNYNVCLIVTDAGLGCADTSCTNFNVVLCSYQNGYIADSIPQGNPNHFLVWQPNAGYNYSWTFGDGGTASGDSVTHVFSGSGFFDVCLFVSDPTSGCSDSSCAIAYYDPCGIGQASLSVNSNGTNATCTLNPFYPNNNLSYAWSFPNGSPSSGTGQSASTNYGQLGSASACAYVTLSGCTDTFCQSFTLTTAAYSIMGHTYIGGNPNCAVVYLIRQDTVGHLVLIDSVVTIDSMGLNCNQGYVFSNLPVDTYYVKAALQLVDPNYAYYLPTYYGDVLQWGMAQAVYLNSDQSGIDISLIAGSNPGGPGFVGGWVSQGAGIVFQGGQNNGSRSLGDPLAGVQINLLTSLDVPVGYTYTDVNGHYQFSNLALGSYKIYAEELNKIPNPIPFTLTADNLSDSSVNMSINSTSETATGVQNVSDITVNGIYPNPTTSGCEVQLSCKQAAHAVIKLTDVLGKTVMEREANLTIGSNTFYMEMEKMAAGVYQLSVQSDNINLTYKVVKAK